MKRTVHELTKMIKYIDEKSFHQAYLADGDQYANACLCVCIPHCTEKFFNNVYLPTLRQIPRDILLGWQTIASGYLLFIISPAAKKQLLAVIAQPSRLHNKYYTRAQGLRRVLESGRGGTIQGLIIPGLEALERIIEYGNA